GGSERAAPAEARAGVTGLPEGLPPLGSSERMLPAPSRGRPRRRDWATRIGLAGLAATAAVWLGVVALTGLDSRRPSGVPALNSLVGFHEEAPRTTSSDEAETQDEAAHLGLPAELGDYELVGVSDRAPEPQVVYLEGAAALSIFLFQRFEIDESQLPEGTAERVVDGRMVWLVPDEPSPMLVAQIGPNAVVMIGGDAQSAMAGD